MRRGQVYYQVSADVYAETRGEVVLATVAGKAVIHEIGGAGKDLWKWLQQPMSVSEMAAKVETKFHISRKQAETDVQKFLKQSMKQGLIVRVEYNTGNG